MRGVGQAVAASVVIRGAPDATEPTQTQTRLHGTAAGAAAIAATTVGDTPDVVPELVGVAQVQMLILVVRDGESRLLVRHRHRQGWFSGQGQGVSAVATEKVVCVRRPIIPA